MLTSREKRNHATRDYYLFEINYLQHYDWVVCEYIICYWLGALIERSLRAARFSLSFASTLSLLIGRLADVWPGKT